MDKQTQEMFTALQMRIDSLEKKLDTPIVRANENVDKITPYTETKTAYIDDEYVTFDIAKDGIISVQMVDNDGQNVPCSFEQINGKVKVSFEKRNSLATVTISIQ